MAVLAFFTSILFIPGLPSAATTPRYALLALFVPFIWYSLPAKRITVGHLIGALFLCWCAITLLWAFNFQDGIYQIGKFVLFGLLFCIGATRNSLRNVYIACAIGVGVNSVIVMGQYWGGWTFIPQVAFPGGLFFNKNFGAEFAALILAALVVERLWWLVPVTFPTLILCQSRASVIALSCGAILLVYQHNKRLAIGLFMALIGLGIYLWAMNYTAHQRWDLWRDTFASMQFWGRGIGAYYTTFPENAIYIDSLTLRPTAAHNDLLQLTYELGPGILIVLGLVSVALLPPMRSEHYVLSVFLVEGLVGFPLYMPATAFVAALVLGRLCGDGPDIRSAFDWCRVRVLSGLQDSGVERGRAVPPANSPQVVPL